MSNEMTQIRLRKQDWLSYDNIIDGMESRAIEFIFKMGTGVKSVSALDKLIII